MATTVAKTASKYTPAMEAAIRAEPLLNAEVAERLAASFGPSFTARMVIAKINRMTDVTYVNKAKVTKSGGKVESKADIVAQIQEMVKGNLEGLDKAPKPALQTVRDYLAA